jgi:dTDP-4-amino-4,6-dideoxygalactose transaminase
MKICLLQNKTAEEVICLPIYPELKIKQIKDII